MKIIHNCSNKEEFLQYLHSLVDESFEQSHKYNHVTSFQTQHEIDPCDCGNNYFYNYLGQFYCSKCFVEHPHIDGWIIKQK